MLLFYTYMLMVYLPTITVIVGIPLLIAGIILQEKKKRLAKVFIIIGTSLNVYPAAGLLNYVSVGVPIYLVDPNDVEVRGVRGVTAIKKGASDGIQEIIDKYL